MENIRLTRARALINIIRAKTGNRPKSSGDVTFGDTTINYYDDSVSGEFFCITYKEVKMQFTSGKMAIEIPWERIDEFKTGQWLSEMEEIMIPKDMIIINGQEYSLVKKGT